MEKQVEVEIAQGFTKNMGNFESIKSEIRVRLCGDDKEKLFNEGEKFVDEKIGILLDELKTLKKG